MISVLRVLFPADYQLWGRWTFNYMVFDKPGEIPDWLTGGVDQLFVAAVRHCQNGRPSSIILHIELGLIRCGLSDAGVRNLRCTNNAIYNV